MSKRFMLLALTVVSVAMFAVPSVAAAGEWKPDGFGAFSGTNNTTTTLTQDGSNESVSCTANSDSGEYESETTGKDLTITFTGCTAAGAECHSAGQANGVIKTFALTFHNVMLEATEVSGFPKGTPGILITPNANGEFATFVCGGIITIHVKGNGLIGDVTKECGSSTAANTPIALDFTSSAQGTQRWNQVTTTGTVYDLTAVTTFFGTTERTGSQDGEGAIKFGAETKVTCP